MTNTLIYIYGSGLEIDVKELEKRMIHGYCLINLTEDGDNKLTFDGEGVSELILSKNLDFIKIDAEDELFVSLLYEFSQHLNNTEPPHVYSFGFSGDPSDYKSLPRFENEEQCLEFIRKHSLES